MILEEFLNLVFRKEWAKYHIAIIDDEHYEEGFRIYSYNEIRKSGIYKKEIREIYNFSPNKYCFGHYWLIVK